MSRSANYRKKGKGNKHNGGGFRHSKSLGQNFLEDMDIVREIVEGSMVDRDTVVIEIGPGQGCSLQSWQRKQDGSSLLS